ncbi:hypothetical protein [uncultured Marinococcus sp.]|uniref:hypothetical protein n=1 Tax=uncultured Marinococcus sp. TaxID=487012 RepID=UPI002625867B|nr:hypothetical protein [uncultured Marinococcus sp.]
MSNLSIDDLYERIYHSNTKKYFQEVYQSYVNKSYRSATVMLYTIVISDLVYKLKELKELYADEKAIAILTEIQDMMVKHARSPEWETKLVESVEQKTNLLEIHDKENIDHLKHQRHLCAHPVLTEVDLLYNPNKDQVKAHMRNMLEGVLIKPSILSNELTQNFVMDISKVKDILVKDEALERYIDNKYFQLIGPQLFRLLFKNLWKFVFKLRNEECNENREVNFRVIQIMLKKEKQHLLDYISSESKSFSSISESKELLSYTIKICSLYNIYPRLQQHAQELIKAETNNDLSFYVRTTFLASSYIIHLKSIQDKIIEDHFGYNKELEKEDIEFLHYKASEYDSFNDFLDFLIYLFSKSQNFDAADYRFNQYISPYLDYFNESQFKMLVNSINQNSQLSGRRKAVEDNNRIKTFADVKLDQDFKYEEYDNFKLT